jgi:hypothetical protein
VEEPFVVLSYPWDMNNQSHSYFPYAWNGSNLNQARTFWKKLIHLVLTMLIFWTQISLRKYCLFYLVILLLLFRGQHSFQRWALGPWFQTSRCLAYRRHISFSLGALFSFWIFFDQYSLTPLYINLLRTRNSYRLSNFLFVFYTQNL